MRQVLSLSVSSKEVEKTRRLAHERGFETISAYVRFLLSQDDSELISENELLRRSKNADILHKNGALIHARSMKDLLR